MHRNNHHKSDIKNKSGCTEQNAPIKFALQKINELQNVKSRSKPKKLYLISPYDDKGPEEVDVVVVNP